MRRSLAAIAVTSLVAVGAPTGVAAVAVQPDRSTLPAAIKLRSRTFTPRPGLERDTIVGTAGGGASRRSLAPSSSEPVHFLVQFSELPRGAARRSVDAAGVDLLASLGGGTYVASAPVDDLDHVAALPGFRWAGPLLAGDKVDPHLASGADVPWAWADDGRIALTVQVHPDVSMESALEVAGSHGAQVVASSPLPSVTALFDNRCGPGAGRGRPGPVRVTDGCASPGAQRRCRARHRRHTAGGRSVRADG